MKLQGEKIDTPSELIAWFTALLRERFELDVRVIRDGSYFFIKNGQSEASIKLGPLIPSFYDMSTDFCCGVWEPSKDSAFLSSRLVNMPTPGMAQITYPLISKEGSNYLVGYDLLGFAFWMMCRVEEVNPEKLDRYERFHHTSSHAFKNNYLHRPIVDEWLELLKVVIKECWGDQQLKQANFRMEVSHDVDRPCHIGPNSWSFLSVLKSLRTIAVDVFIRKDMNSLKLRSLSLNPRQLNKSDQYNTFDWIMAQSEKYDVTSTFYFIAGMSSFSKDSGYTIEHRAIRHLIRSIIERGHSVGLHPSFNSFKDQNVIKAEAVRLKRVLDSEGMGQDFGARMHYLRWKHPLTLLALTSAGLKYDASMTYAEQPGFRCGTCFDFIAYCPVSNKMLELRVKPLIAMEASLIDYRKVDQVQADLVIRELLLLKAACRSVGGTFSLLWHNSELLHEEHRKAYKAILAG